MRLSFILAVVASFKLTVSMPTASSDDSFCPETCQTTKYCCSGFKCEDIGFLWPAFVCVDHKLGVPINDGG
ncbi:uncharacterized protein HD556DRAFT_1402973 [Suillus plorans]|uniref:Uncharacterized protein n=1 Tax=Suillus plorans TaxID=116603 RepID=A0A9P7DDL1_9AGAM|nr:uncharacterized protein HD556DRAFT_1402973 [Suillus plorans]KAG1788552.1 hypothetical protein HD556DRAFT_1402973 [Suillus plorans]